MTAETIQIPSVGNRRAGAAAAFARADARQVPAAGSHSASPCVLQPGYDYLRAGASRTGAVSNHRGLTSTVRIAHAGSIAGIRVRVALDGLIPDRLFVAVITPGGQVAVLHEAPLAPPRVALCFDGMAHAELRQCAVGGGAEGQWRLFVAQDGDTVTSVHCEWSLALTLMAPDRFAQATG